MPHRSLPLGLMAVLVFLATGCRSTPGPVPSGAPADRRVAALDEKQVFIDMSTVRIAEGDAERVLGVHRPHSASEPTFLTKAEASVLFAAWRENPSVRIVGSPKILALNHQRASLYIGETVNFGKSKAEHTEKGLTFSIVDDPKGPVYLGQRIFVTADISDDSSHVALSIHQEWREAGEGATTEAAIQGGAEQFRRDYTHGQSFDVDLELANNGTALVGDPSIIEDNEGRHIRLTLVTVRVLEGREAAQAVISNMRN